MTVEELYSPCKQVLVVRSCEGSWLSPDNIRDSVTGDFGIRVAFRCQQMTMLSALNSSKPAPPKYVEIRIYLGEKRLVWAANLDRPAEAHFSTRLQAQLLFASVTRGEVGLHLGTSPIALIRFTLALTRTCKKQRRYPLKRKPGRTRLNSDEAGATPPFDVPCVTASVGSLPPQSRAARDPFSRVPEPEFRSCKTMSITPP
jgi:hypothetical protein